MWQGPPGTGKTRALTAFVEAAVFFALEERASSRQKTKNKTGTKTTNASAGPVALACAASNVAVDNIVAGLISSDTRVGAERRPLRVVRLGSPAKVQATLEASTLGAQAALTPLGRKAAAMRAEARGDYTSRGAATRRLAFQLETQAAHAVLRAADVVCATCVGAGDDLLEGFTFRVACVDEAAQCPEPAALIPVSKALTCVLVGDAAQLPPTVTSMDALHAGLGVSLFERMERLGVVPDLLDRQYRMHPALAEFPSARFYGGRVASDPAPADRPPPPGAPWARRDAGVDARPRSNSNAWSPYPVLFVEVDGGRERRARRTGSASSTRPRRARRWRRRRRCWRRPRTETRRIESRISRAISGSSRRTPRRCGACVSSGRSGPSFCQKLVRLETRARLRAATRWAGWRCTRWTGSRAGRRR